MTQRLDLPSFARPVRGLPSGLHPYLVVLPGIVESPALQRIGTAQHLGEDVVRSAQVHIRPENSFCWVDVSVPCIVLSERYYQTGDEVDLYLDLLHELTHIRQHAQGRDLWDRSFAYHRRPTEIEGYAVAVGEARRIGMSEAEILAHLSNPWMSPAEVQELLGSINAFLVS